MKILIVRTFPDIINPHQYNVQEIGLAKALVRKGYDCGIVLYNGKNKDETEYIPVSCDGEVRNITLYKLNGFCVLKNGFFLSLNKIVKQYDVIQVHEYDQITSWMYYAWSKKPVVIYHGPYYHEFNKGYNFKCKIFDNTFLRLRHNRNTFCLTKSELAAEFLKSKGFKNVKTVGVGLDVENFENTDKVEGQAIPINSEKCNVIYVGKIEERRNPYFLLRVMEELSKRNTDINCIIVGNGEEGYVQDFMDKAESMLKSGRLQYYKKASQGQLAQLYKKAKLMLFPTNYDIFGMVLLEAVYFGLPVLSSRNGGSDVIFGHKNAGIVLTDFELKKWVESAEEILEERKNITETVQGKNVNVSWDTIATEFISTYEEIK